MAGVDGSQIHPGHSGEPSPTSSMKQELTLVSSFTIMGEIPSFQENIISISKLTDILAVLLFTVVVCAAVLIYLRDHPYYLILALVLSVLINVIYIFLKIKGKPPPPKDTGRQP